MTIEEMALGQCDRAEIAALKFATFEFLARHRLASQVETGEVLGKVFLCFGYLSGHDSSPTRLA
jgi:hypothetical protein